MKSGSENSQLVPNHIRSRCWMQDELASRFFKAPTLWSSAFVGSRTSCPQLPFCVAQPVMAVGRQKNRRDITSSQSYRRLNNRLVEPRNAGELSGAAKSSLRLLR